MGILDAPARPTPGPRPATVVLWGDSITANNGPAVGGTTTRWDAIGYWSWAQRRLGHRLHVLKNAGVNGQTSAQILARFDADVRPYAPGYVIILAGRNDGAIGAAATEANLAAMYDKCASIGAVVVACTLPPLNTPATGQRAADNQTNQWIKRQAQVRSGFLVVDWTAALQDTSGNFPTGAGGLSADGTHPVMLGAYRMGRVMARTLDPVIPKVDRCVTNNDDVACLLANPLMFGTGGTLNNGGTGTIAANWQGATVGSGASYSVAQVPCTDMPNLNWHELTVTATGTGGGQLLQYPTGIGSVSGRVAAARGDGNLYVASCEFELDTLTSSVALNGYGPGLTLKVGCLDGSFASLSTALDLGLGTTAEAYPLDGAQETAGVLRTPPIQIPAGTVNLQVAVTLLAVGKVRVRRVDLRRVLPAGAA